jgi:hypothetical protein
VVGGEWCKPIIVLSFGFGQAEQKQAELCQAKEKQECITFHRGANYTLRLILEGLKSSNKSHAQEKKLFDFSKNLVNF